ncbi:DUF58 domain-containing protein [Nakamurella sp. YIM 132087]|uniref:DUF58 domain-containing protein n=1 Tax=Nakamurella alba TaxID=2665158 RepID=A0A7K1FGK2_9ACTN|nr:DUF58 domain-containing protein [Nakamurella alba]MTD13232.1 DUF58 domain-containing protein [Nakamurella alba]
MRTPRRPDAPPAATPAPAAGARPGALAGLDLRVRRLVRGRGTGLQTGSTLGPGSDPEEVARYRPGEDDVRRIDWNVTARSGDTHVWRTRADHELETWVLLDTSASMSFGTVEIDKAELATGVGAAVGLLTDQPGNLTGVARFTGADLRWGRPRTSRTAAAQLLSGRPERGRQRAEPAADLAAAIRLLDRRRRAPGLRVVVSDFLPPDGRTERPFDWESPLRRLAARHDVLVAEVLDPRELTLPDVGALVLQDPESGARQEFWTSSRRLREDYARLAAAHRKAIAAAVRGSGSAHVVLHTDRDWVRDLARHVTRRGRSAPTVPTPRRPT